MRRAACGTDVNLLGSPGGPRDDLAVLQGVGVRLQKGVAAFGEPAPPCPHPEQCVPDQGLLPTDDVDQFHERGRAIHDGASWKLSTELDGGLCAGDCEVTDIVRVTWTFSPGRAGDRFDFHANYLRDADNFRNIYANGYVYCDGDLCGDAAIGRGEWDGDGGSGSVTIRHDDNEGGHQVDAVRLQATFRPNSTRYFDLAKSGVARCSRGDDRNCRF